VIVYGDTNSTLAGALAAAKLHIPVAHVEAGLRSFNRRMPEETNRILADHCSDFLFTPTDLATANLRAEGVADHKVCQVGDVMYDSALHLTADQTKQERLLRQFGLSSGDYALVTVHREENTSDHTHLAGIIRALETVSMSLPVLFPIHPRTRKALESLDVSIGNQAGLQVVEPLDYFDIVSLEKHARVIATDSGGMQKEAYFFGVPCITLREETEWVELLDTGWNTLVSPADSNSIADAITTAAPPKHSGKKQLYGDGRAAEKIVDILAGASQG
jgi:UDP-GlcNAc3NAcA epimerase